MTELPGLTTLNSFALSNGMRVVLERQPRRRNAAVGILTHTGARDEPAGQDGVSHFLEHLSFKGTPARTAREINLQFDRMGASVNAFTSEEVTCYYAYAPTGAVLDAIEILFDLMRPLLPPDEIELERKVVLEEIAMYDDRPDMRIMDDIMTLAFSNQPLGRSVLGTVETVSALTPDAIRAYHANHYTPDNMTFYAAGEFDPDAVRDTIESASAGWVAGSSKRAPVSQRVLPERKFTVRENLAIQHVIIAVNAPSMTACLQPAAAVLEIILGDDFGSVYFNTITRSGLAESVSADFYPCSDTGVMLLSASADAGNAPEVIHRLIGGYRRLMENGVDTVTLERAKRKRIMELYQDAETPLDRFQQLVSRHTDDINPASVDDLRDRVRALTPDTMREYFETFPLTDDTFALAGIGPLNGVSGL